jgi:YD repeat-containing protein
LAIPLRDETDLYFGIKYSIGFDAIHVSGSRRGCHGLAWVYQIPFESPLAVEKPDIPEASSGSGFDIHDDRCSTSSEVDGSIIDCENQTLHEEIPIPGTPYSLFYSSNKVPGFVPSRSTKILLVGDTIPANLETVELDLSIGGQTTHHSFTPSANLSYTFLWDGTDDAGRTIVGGALLEVVIRYVGAINSEEKRYSIPLTNFGYAMSPLGGWFLNVHHVYEGTSDLLLSGYGRQRLARVSNVAPIAGEKRVPSSDGSLVFIFDLGGRHLRTENALTGATLLAFSYTADGDLLSVTDAHGSVTEFLRNNRELTGVLAPNGLVTDIEIGTDGYIETVRYPKAKAEDAEAPRYHMTYHSGGLLATLRTPGIPSDVAGYEFFYSDDGRLTMDRDPLGGYQELTREETLGGYKVTKTDALANFLTYDVSFTADGKRTRTLTGEDGFATTLNEDVLTAVNRHYPDGSVSEVFFKDHELFGSTVREISSTTLTTPSGLKRYVFFSKRYSPAGAMSIDEVETIESFRTINGLAHKELHNLADGLHTFTSPLGRQSSLYMNDVGQLTSIMAPGRAPVNVVHNAQGQVEEVWSEADGERRSFIFEHDPLTGYLVKVTNPLGETVAFDHDALGRVLSETSSRGVVSYEWDLDGNMSSLRTPGNTGYFEAFEFEHTLLGQLETVTHPLAYTPYEDPRPVDEYRYDLSRDLDGVTRADDVIDFSVDSVLGRVDSKTTPEGDFFYHYDDTSGVLKSISDPYGGTLTYERDGPLLREISWTGSTWNDNEIVDGAKVTQIFNDDMTLASRSVNGAHEIAFGYDLDGLRVRVGRMQVDYDPLNGDLTGTTLDFVTDSYTYNGFGEVETYKAEFNGPWYSDIGHVVLYEATYIRDALGRIDIKEEFIDGELKVYDYDYDASGRLEFVRVD